MKTVSLSGSLRENVGKKDTKALRKAEMVPCVMYGANQEQIHFATESKNFKQILFTPETFVIEFTVNGKTYKTILQEIQYHPVTDNVLHADFLIVDENNPVTVALPIATEGTSPGVMRGGKMKINMRKVKVSGLIKDLPEYIVLDISKLNIGNSIKVQDLAIENVKAVSPASSVIIDIKAGRGASIAAADDAE